MSNYKEQFMENFAVLDDYDLALMEMIECLEREGYPPSVACRTALRQCEPLDNGNEPLLPFDLAPSKPLQVRIEGQRYLSSCANEGLFALHKQQFYKFLLKGKKNPLFHKEEMVGNIVMIWANFELLCTLKLVN